MKKVTDSRDSDLSVARRVQAAMVPKSLPFVEGLHVSTLYLPCKEVGGDLYDVIKINENTIAFLVYDVTGFGISSALISALAKVSFSNHLRTGFSPRAVIELVNRDLLEDLKCNFYLTAFLGYLDTHDNKLTYCNAGHAYPLVYRKSNSKNELLKTQGTFLGVLEDGFYEEHSIFLNPGDCLVLFTDGLLKLYSEDLMEGRRIFENMLPDLLAKSNPEVFISSIREYYNQVLLKRELDDDITMLTVEVLSQSRKEQIKADLGFSAAEPAYIQYLSYFEEMDRAVAVILSSMDSFGYADDSIRRMKITLTELLVNAISHGNTNDFSKKVIMGHVVDKIKAVVAIMDEGDGFNPQDVPDPTLPENLIKDCGRGLFIVKHYVDSVSFNENGNRVTIVKYHT